MAADSRKIQMEGVGKASARNRRLLVELLTDYYPLGGISKLKEYREVLHARVEEYRTDDVKKFLESNKRILRRGFTGADFG